MECAACPSSSSSTVFRGNAGRKRESYLRSPSPTTPQHRVPGDQIVRPDPVNGHIRSHCCPNLWDSARCEQCTHNLLAHWKGAVAFSACFGTCFAMVPVATNQCTVSPTTTPLTPPSGFCNAVNRPKRSPSTSGSLPCCQTRDRHHQ